MKIKGWMTVLALCAGCVGCGPLEETFMSADAKVNAAYPVSADVRVAQERLLGLLAGDGKATAALKAQVSSRMTLRGLGCSKSASIGRFDSVAAVKNMAIDRRCLQDEDKELMKFYAVKTIGVLLARPPLRPLKPAGPIAALPKGGLTYVNVGTFAREAGVAVLRDGQGDALVVEVPGGRPIAQLPRASPHEPSSRLSPNGQVFVVNTLGQGPVFYEAETGNRLWDAADGGRLLAWLPEVASFIYAARDGSVLLADGQSGTVTPHPVASRNSSYSAHIPGQPARTLIGSSHELQLVEHVRSAEGMSASSIRQYRISPGPGITSGQPVSMRSGKLVVFASMRDIGWLDLESGASGVWKGSPYFGIPFAKLDETHIMFDSPQADRSGLKPWSFDIVAETVTPLDLGGSRGQIVDIGERVGFMRRANEAWFGDEVKAAGEASPLDKVVVAYELEQQLAKLQAQAGDERAAAEGAAAGGGGALDAQRRAIVPGLGNVPKDAQVHMIGVYEGKRGPGSPSGSSSKQEVRVVVRPSSRPIVLVLASYEPVSWTIMNSGARISAVLLSGYHPSTASGIGNAPVLRIGSAYAYSAQSSEYNRLRQAVMQYTGPLEMRSFQGSYSGSDFRIDGY